MGRCLRGAPSTKHLLRLDDSEWGGGEHRRSSSPATRRPCRCGAHGPRPGSKTTSTNLSRRQAPRRSVPFLAPPPQPGLFPRWNGSAFYPTKIPDLIGIKDRKYIDHTATHQHRGPGDLMRYAALVTFSDSSDFGPHRMLTDEQRHVPFPRTGRSALRAGDVHLLAASRRANPNRDNPGIADGQRVFQREGCGGCHTPPLYTNNRLTLASGLHATAGAFQVSRHHARVSGDRSEPRVEDQKRHRLLQGAVAERRVVPRALSP